MEYSVENKMLEIIGNSDDKMPTQEIAKELRLDRHTVSKYLEILHSKGLIECKIIGRTKLWYPSVSPVLSIIKEGNPFKEVLNSFDEGIAIISKEDKIIWSNNKINKKAGSYCYEIYDKEHCKDCPAVKTFKTGKKYKTINTYKRNRKKISYEITTSPIKDTNENTVAIMEVSKRIRG